MLCGYFGIATLTLIIEVNPRKKKKKIKDIFKKVDTG